MRCRLCSIGIDMPVFEGLSCLLFESWYHSKMAMRTSPLYVPTLTFRREDRSQMSMSFSDTTSHAFVTSSISSQSAAHSPRVRRIPFFLIHSPPFSKLSCKSTTGSLLYVFTVQKRLFERAHTRISGTGGRSLMTVGSFIDGELSSTSTALISSSCWP